MANTNDLEAIDREMSEWAESDAAIEALKNATPPADTAAHSVFHLDPQSRTTVPEQP